MFFRFLNRRWGILVVILVSIISVAPLFHAGFFPMHDDTQVARVFEMGKSLSAGMFPVRWVPDLGYGYGYPLFNFYAPLAYYVGGLFTLLGTDALLATKLMIGIGMVLSGISMYFLAREFWGEIGGIVSALFYVFLPYHAVDLYVRGDVAELYAYAFIPLVFLGFYKVYKNYNDYNRYSFHWTVLAALSYAAVIISHNLTAMMVTPFLIIFSVFLILSSKQKLHSTFYILHSTILALALSAFYWLPALSEMGKTNVLGQIGGGADFHDHFVCPSQLWDSPWGFGGSVKGCIDGLSFKIGKLHIIGVILAVFSLLALFLERKKHVNDMYHYSQQMTAIILAGAGFLLSVFFTLQFSKPVWEAIRPMAFFQYPWRFLLMIGFFSSFLTGSIIYALEKIPLPKFTTAVAALLFVAGILLLNAKLFVPQATLSKTATDYTNEYALKWIASKTSDEYLLKGFKRPKDASHVFHNSPPRYHQTAIEIAANVVTIASITVLILGIIFPKDRLLWTKKPLR